MLQIIKEDYLHKTKEAFLNTIAKIQEQPKSKKRDAIILKEFTPIISEMIIYYEDKIKKVEAEYKEFEWQWKGRMKLAVDSEKQIGMMIEHLKRLKAENKSVLKTNRKLTVALNKSEKRNSRLEYRLYDRWYKLRDWLIKRVKNTVKKYTKKKKTQLLKLERKINNM